MQEILSATQIVSSHVVSPQQVGVAIKEGGNSCDTRGKPGKRALFWLWGEPWWGGGVTIHGLKNQRIGDAEQESKPKQGPSDRVAGIPERQVYSLRTNLRGRKMKWGARRGVRDCIRENKTM